MYGFPKSAKNNIAPDETREFKKLAKILFNLTGRQLESLLENGDFTELSYTGGHDHDKKL